jgi:hypothetical protein
MPTIASPAKDLRKFVRIPFNTDVQLRLSDRTLTVQLMDIALKGALVQSDAAQTLALNDSCRLRLPLADDGEGLTMTGKIVHLEAPLIGIECLDIDVVSLTRLRRLIELNSGDPALIDRDLTRLFAKA